MSQQVQFQVTPEQAKNDIFLKNRIKDELQLSSDDFHFVWRKRSIDARKAAIKMNCLFDVYLDGEEIPDELYYESKDVSNCTEIGISYLTANSIRGSRISTRVLFKTFF